MDIFYAPEITDSQHFLLPEEESQHCARVLRHQSDDLIDVVDGRGTLYHARITAPHPKHTEVEVIGIEHDFGAHNYRLHMAVAPTKNIDRFEWFVEKAVEIGVDEITPLLCRFSERKVINKERIEKIIISAAKQSRKAMFPKLNEMTEFSKFFSANDFSGSSLFMAHCHDGEKTYLPACAMPDSVVFIGPEGDFSDEEVSLALSHGAKPVSLGTSRLRTETAAVFAVASVSMVSELNKR